MGATQAVSDTEFVNLPTQKNRPGLSTDFDRSVEADTMTTNRETSITEQWKSESRWMGVTRPYSEKDVAQLAGTVRIEHTLARLGAERLWELLRSEAYVPALGAVTGNQAIQQVKAGLKAVYVSGWQVAADANDAGQMYPDLNLYPADSVPNLVRRINQALMRADQIGHQEGKNDAYWFAPLVADGDTGFGGNLNAFELMKAMIEAGAACVHFEDQSSSAKKCGHLGGKVLVPTSEAIQKLVAARLAADVMGVPTLIMARTDAESATLLTSDIDLRDREFLTGSRTAEGLFGVRSGLESAIARAVSYAPYADLVWCETSRPDLGRGPAICGRCSSDPSGEDAGLQLLAIFQLEKASRRCNDRQVSARTCRHGIQVPVCHSGGFPYVESGDVRAGPCLQDQRHGGVFAFAGEGVQP